MNPPFTPNKFIYMRALVLATFFLTLAVIQFYNAALAQTEPPPPGQAWPTDSNSWDQSNGFKKFDSSQVD